MRIKNLDADAAYVVRGFRRTDPQIRRTSRDAAVALGAAAVPALCHLMASPDPVGPSAAREALFSIAARASAPDFPEDSRDALRNLLDEEQHRAESAEVKDYLTWLGGILRTKR